MNLPESEADNVEQRSIEIARNETEGLTIQSYAHYLFMMPKLRPLHGDPRNIRFFPNGVEALVDCVPLFFKSRKELRGDFKFVLIDMGNKSVLKYTIEGRYF